MWQRVAQPQFALNSSAGLLQVIHLYSYTTRNKFCLLKGWRSSSFGQSSDRPTKFVYYSKLESVFFNLFEISILKCGLIHTYANHTF